MALSAWATEAEAPQPFSDSQISRANKRTVEYLGGGVFRVIGEPSLGDAYPDYTVVKNGRYHTCTCQTHTGGQYRRTCTHIVGVVLWKQEHPEWEAAEGEQAERAEIAQERPDPLPGVTTPQTPLTPRGVLVPPARDPSWGRAFPPWVRQFREHQVEAIGEIVEAFERGAKVVKLDAPTGSGKTLIAEVVRRMIGGYALYTCTTKTLQDQFVRDFDYAALLKGRDNYPTELGAFPDVTCGDCTASGADDVCNWCSDFHGCSYRVARTRAEKSHLAVVNTAYMLNAWNKGRGMFLDRDLVIVDECDTLENAVMGFVEVNVSRRMKGELDLGEPRYKTKPESWLEWVERTIPVVRGHERRISGTTTNVRAIRRKRALKNLAENLEVLREGLSGDEVQWVYTDYERGNITFRPVRVDHLSKQYLWPQARRFLLMSASIISPQEMAESLGIEDEWELVTVPSTFPVDNRPVYPVTVANVTSKTYTAAVPRLARALNKILAHHPDERILVHTVSYRLAGDLTGRVVASSDRPVLSYENSYGRQQALEDYMASDNGVLIAPSMDRGVDLPDDLCRVQVICKVPFPYLGDKQVNARMRSKGGRLWYAVQTARTLVQMTGRGVRSSTDHATTYILDEQFKRFHKRWEHLFPGWWNEALDWTGNTRSRLGL